MAQEQKRWHPMVRAFVTLLVLMVMGVGGLFAPTGATWVGAYGRMYTAKQVPAQQVAIVFGAEVYPSGRPSPYLRARLDLGARLYADGKVRRVVVSGDDRAAHHHEPTAMKRYLVRKGVPASVITVDRFGRDTYDTCSRASRVFGVDKAILVSQSYHLRRAITTCRAVGVDAVGVGDVSVKRTTGRWERFEQREIGANVKMVWDVASRRTPVLSR